MHDQVFLNAFYWLFMNHDFVQILSAFFTFVVLMISIILILKRWGDSY